MQRYFLDVPLNSFTTNSVTEEQLHHMLRVMRMKSGDRCYFVFTDQQTAIATLTDTSTPEFEITEIVEENVELPVSVAIVGGLTKADKWETVIQKGTELGAHSFIPLKASRSVVKWDEKKGDKKVERWQKIASEAAEQSHRQCIPVVESPVTLKQLLQHSSAYTHKLVAYEEEARAFDTSKFSTLLQSMKPSDSVMMVFGPEGGLTASEVAELTENGFIPCALGPRILRAETAPLYAMSALSYKLELER